ncbi:MAG: citrate synthase [Deltaproteobacteria bacterium]|nr:citrate synthase [Deltaproteobacteria bacterium]
MVDQRRIDNQPYVDARTASRFLGIQVRTLYAYVSRGLVRSMPGAQGRPRLYAQADLERLKARSAARAGHGAVAAGALRWGEPVLDSAITAITPRGPVYRGRAAVDLLDQRFEHVAELLWSGYLPTAPVTWPRRPLPLALLGKLIPPGTRPLDAMPLVVDLLALSDPQRDDDRADAFIARARTVIPLLAAALAPDTARMARALAADSVATIAARALGLTDDTAAALDAMFVLLADHELNASSFAARVAASTGAGVYACLSAALATLSGPRHGTASERVAAFVDAHPDARAAARAARRSGDLPPGFGHSLYPHGDPRCAPLLALALAHERTRGPFTRRARTLFALADALPGANVDIGLSALIAALGLPPWAGSGLFAVARTAGWIAHVLEQRAAGYLLRPRARYVGP